MTPTVPSRRTALQEGVHVAAAICEGVFLRVLERCLLEFSTRTTVLFPSRPARTQSGKTAHCVGTSQVQVCWNQVRGPRCDARGVKVRCEVQNVRCTT